MVKIKNRYLIIKKMFSDYLILIDSKGKLVSFYRDNDILDYIKFEKLRDLERRKINYLILDNLEIKIKKDYNDRNAYQDYLLKSFIGKILNKIKEGLRKQGI